MTGNSSDMEVWNDRNIYVNTYYISLKKYIWTSHGVDTFKSNKTSIKLESEEDKWNVTRSLPN